jgi:hypothetical protein
MGAHQTIIMLAVGYTLLGVLIFTAVVTCFSLVGWVKFADPKQQNKLFYTLIVEIVAIGVGFFADILRFDPSGVQGEIVKPINDELAESKIKLAESEGKLKNANLALKKASDATVAWLNPKVGDAAKFLIADANMKGVYATISVNQSTVLGTGFDMQLMSPTGAAISAGDMSYFYKVGAKHNLVGKSGDLPGFITFVEVKKDKPAPKTKK